MSALANLVLQSAISSYVQEVRGAVPTSVHAAQTNLAEFIVVALLIDAIIVAVWYMIGYVMNDQKIKANARGEFIQLIGTSIIVAVVVGALAFFASLYMSSFSASGLSPQAMYQTCNTISAGSQLTLFSGNFIAGTSYSSRSTKAPSNPLPPYNLLFGTSSFPGICNMVYDPSTSFTGQIDYPLATSAVLIANLTNQTLTNLNALFTIDTYMGFLDSFTPFVEPVCWSNLEACLLPGAGTINFDLKISFQPYAGYDMIFQSYSPLGDLLSLAFESYVAQFVFIIALLFIWPYMLFVGIVLRATPFTRAIGGLFIAIAIGAVVFMPIIYGLEYVNLCPGVPYYISTPSGPVLSQPSGCQQVAPSQSGSPPPSFTFNSFAYGYNGITQIPENSPTTGNYYDINFFVMPNMTYIATSTAATGGSCWPTGGIIGAELIAIGYSLTPAYAGEALMSSSPASLPSLPGQSCSQQSAIALLYNLFDAYGVVGVSAYFMPIINILVVISAVIGLSGLLGGDTELAGLAKLV